MNASEFNHNFYDALWNALNQELKAIEAADGLSAALEALHAQQFDVGFVQDDLKGVILYPFHHREDPARMFFIQYNPKRALRTLGAGRKAPPPGTTVINGGCFLCRENIRWQQRGIELGYDLHIDNTEYIAWMNPFPLMPVHTTIAKKQHEPQSWIGQGIKPILNDFLELTQRLPDYVGFYNGEGAGASIPQHFHFQFFKRPVDRKTFCLEAAATKSAAGHSRQFAGVIEYPITTIYCCGQRQFILDRVSSWLHNWTQFYGNQPAVSANIIATCDREHADKFHLYFVPRNRSVSHAAGMVGMIGGLEVLGELVFSTEDEKKRLDAADVDYSTVEDVLVAVEAPSVREFLKMI